MLRPSASCAVGFQTKVSNSSLHGWRLNASLSQRVQIAACHVIELKRTEINSKIQECNDMLSSIMLR